MPNTGLFDFQVRTFEALRTGRSVILQAPTGAGKTRAALYPFLYHLAEPSAILFPRRCVYSVPVRVLVNQFGVEYAEIVARYDLRYGLDLRRGVTVQTGERPEDRLFEGDLIFTTIDQTLSNALGVPYAVGRRRANVNVGAVAGSYLVFDEFHLFPPDGAFKTTLQVLRILRHTTSFVLMTATFSATMLAELEHLLGAEVVTVPPDELATIPSQHGKERRFHRVEAEMEAGAVLDRHARRSIAICNTVERAQHLYAALEERGCRPLPVGDERLSDVYAALREVHRPDERERALDEALERLYVLLDEQAGWEQATWVVLLHSRFIREHRDLKEALVRREFGPPEKLSPRLPSLVLVATQVIEVGLDITCGAMHTEVAPVSSVLQRAGRCARFAGEQGDVYVYDVPVNKAGAPNYAPYRRDLCEKTWDAFQARHGATLDFYAEQEIVEEVHSETDRKLLADMQAEERQIWEDILQGMALGDSSVRPRLIRRVDSRTLLVHDDPSQLGNPFACRGFSLWHGTLRGKFEALWDRADALDLEWAFRRPVEDEGEEDARAPSCFNWPVVSSEELLSLSVLFAVHPALVAYDTDVGFRFILDDETQPDESGWYRTPPAPARGTRREQDYSYQLESFTDHVRKMLIVYRRELAEPVTYAAVRLEEHLGLPTGSVDRAIRLAIALHDVGKLQVRWQKWAQVYQEATGEGVPGFPLAHTHWEPELYPIHRQAKEEANRAVKKPPHAGEGAVAVAKLVHRAVGGSEVLRRAVLTAIAHHHSPQAKSFDEGYRLKEPTAQVAVAEALALAGIEEGEQLAAALLTKAPATSLEQLVLQLDNSLYWYILYFLIVRAVRLADGKSQE
ncbi:MAG TPA: DEAD/DEAH box helicase [Anaerolineae bacterium]|nr:DEAD/DEAH box helicase [Anaerolineae bacterium]